MRRAHSTIQLIEMPPPKDAEHAQYNRHNRCGPRGRPSAPVARPARKPPPSTSAVPLGPRRVPPAHLPTHTLYGAALGPRAARLTAVRECVRRLPLRHVPLPVDPAIVHLSDPPPPLKAAPFRRSRRPLQPGELSYYAAKPSQAKPSQAGAVQRTPAPVATARSARGCACVRLCVFVHPFCPSIHAIRE